MSETEVLEVANKIVRPHGLTAEFLGDFFSIGVGGDCRTCTRIIVLAGPNPGHEVVATLSTQISNQTGINRVSYELIRKE